MENLFENIIGQSLLCGGIFIIAAAILYIFPPKKINYIYGYRTAASMRSQERWDFSQKHGAKQLALGGLILIIISFGGKLYAVPENYQTAVGVVITLVVVGFVLFSTEKAIKKRFAKT